LLADRREIPLPAHRCRDLGILPRHPLWREAARAMAFHGDSLARLLKDLIHRPFQPLLEAQALECAQTLPLPTPALAATGPP
jgi:hypothetical protein